MEGSQLVEILIILFLALNYVIPYKGLVKLSKNEENILDSYEHVKLELTGDKEELIAEDVDSTANEEFGTMNVLGDLTPTKNESEDFTDIDLKDIY